MVIECMELIFIIALLLCWGSFLNVLGHRLVNEHTRGQRSQCPQCRHTLAWYDLIPLISWVMLRGHCRTCKKYISYLYPLIELLTVVVGLMLFYIVPSTHYRVGYGIFFSALLVATRSDLESMLISRWSSLYLAPLGLLFSIRLPQQHGVLAEVTNLIPITFSESFFGALIGFSVFWIAAYFFEYMTGKEGLGLGDADLLCLIGAFTGPIGVWASVLVGSIMGSIVGILYALYARNYRQVSMRELRIPFGPFLALGAIVYVLYQAKAF